MNCQVLTLMATWAISLQKIKQFWEGIYSFGGLNHKVQSTFNSHCRNGVIVKVIIQS